MAQAFTPYGWKVLLPRLMLWQGVLKFSEMTHSTAREPSGVELVLKSRIAHCRWWRPKSLLVPAAHVGGCPAGWWAQQVASLWVQETSIGVRGCLSFLECCTNIFQGDGLPWKYRQGSAFLKVHSLPVLLGHHYLLRCFISLLPCLTFVYI